MFKLLKFLKDHFSFDPKKPVGDTSSGVNQAQSSLDEMIETNEKTEMIIKLSLIQLTRNKQVLP